MCILDDYRLEHCLSIDSIKHSVDDYSIYSHYVGEELELGRVYSSPLRNVDEHPSFSLFETETGDILFKDHGTGVKGNVFRFVQYLMSEDKDNLISFRDVLSQINLDFDLGLDGTPKTFKPNAKIVAKRIRKEIPKIEIVSKHYSKRFLDYFLRYGITQKTLQQYGVFDVSALKYRYKLRTSVHYPKDLCIAYRIGKYYKIYRPFADRSDKFRSDLPRNYVEGFLQLKGVPPYVIITKSLKDVIFLREHLGIDAVAGKSENTMIPDFLMQKLFDTYDKVFIWLDRDSGGKAATENYLLRYPELTPVNFPDWIKEKDITDRYIAVKEQVVDEIRQLLNVKLK